MMDREAKERLAEALGAEIHGSLDDVELPLGKILAEIDELIRWRSEAEHRYGTPPYERQLGEINMAKMLRDAVVYLAKNQTK